MKNIFLIFFFLSINAIGQAVEVIGFSSKQPVSFASIAYYKKGNIIAGDYADKNGKFNLNVQDFEMIEISCIGYETKKINKADVAKQVFLMEVPIDLNEVVINSNATFDIGYSKSKRKKINSRLGIGKLSKWQLL
ncbi:carboxypeptidase-like regulatory domain-containing protein [Flavobacterium sp. DG1-102-2]|uniref:carboxypeptidase-like regulatory domain-containing protein n=1 Tax=Flavobacterium sp. DG1-102-2 TaxID=3081663 RepID=UPI0029491697|nr:carboxypeptidase-like regulatory domain-containing protein [Flavobacterium sp. DG1-102-2]MDV6169095.1 carboxypeptidase-like regulatory domain-containing protein [Flavobacterium sp. DG1-102-2]